MSPQARGAVPTNNSTSTPLLGGCWLMYGILRLVMAALLFLFSTTATLMFGALLSRVPNPFALMSDFHLLYTAIIALSILAGLFGILAGLALLANQVQARPLALVASFLSVSEIPLGITLGIYTLIVLLPLANARRVRTSE
ncbi:MAG: hypothetical protein WCE52_11040 [Candidatus Acidiferrum sp.]